MILSKPIGATTNRKRLGRGAGSGTGCTAGKGTKGQKARSGKKIRPGFEGGQMPLYRRIPARGFSNYPFKQTAKELTLRDLNRHYKSGETVTLENLYAKGLIQAKDKFVKVLNTGELTHALTLDSGIYTTNTAREKIIAAGGNVSVSANGAIKASANAQVNTELNSKTSNMQSTEIGSAEAVAQEQTTSETDGVIE